MKKIKKEKCEDAKKLESLSTVLFHHDKVSI
jgi:hypothetical protein